MNIHQQYLDYIKQLCDKSKTHIIILNQVNNKQLEVLKELDRVYCIELKELTASKVQVHFINGSYNKDVIGFSKLQSGKNYSIYNLDKDMTLKQAIFRDIDSGFTAIDLVQRYNLKKTRAYAYMAQHKKSKKGEAKE